MSKDDIRNRKIRAQKGKNRIKKEEVDCMNERNARPGQVIGQTSSPHTAVDSGINVGRGVGLIGGTPTGPKYTPKERKERERKKQILIGNTQM